MGRRRKKKNKSSSGGGGGSNADDIKRENPLQAIILADSFNTKFRPLTLETPRALLPLVNIPLLEYTIEFLASAGVRELFVFCCWKADAIEAYLRTSRWSDPGSSLRISTIVNTQCINAGDALREIYNMRVIVDDFIIVSGDVVSNMSLKPVIAAHKARREKDKGALITSVFSTVEPGHRTRPAGDALVLAHHPTTQQLLAYTDDASATHIALEKRLFAEHGTFALRHDLLDCFIDVCAPEVLDEFFDNFDYTSMRGKFFSQILGADLMDHKAHVHVISSEYAARVQCLGTYAAVSKDVVHRWAFPVVPDANLTGTSYKCHRHNVYKEDAVTLARSCTVGGDTVLGGGTEVRERAHVESSVIGRGCVIGAGAVVVDAYLWDGAVVCAGARVTSAIVASGAVVGEDAVVAPGCVVSYGVRVPEGERVAPNTRLTLCGDDGAFVVPEDDASTLVIGERHEPRLDEGSETQSDDEEDGDSSDEGWGVAADDDGEEQFVKEVFRTVRRAAEEEHDTANVILEINGLKFAYDRTFSDCCNALVPAIVTVAVDVSSNAAVIESTEAMMARWSPLLLKFCHSVEDQIEILFALHQFCLDHPEFIKTIRVLLQRLYEADLVDEEAVSEWSARASEDAEGEEEQELLALAKPFVDWLCDDSGSSSDGEYDDSGESGDESGDSSAESE